MCIYMYVCVYTDTNTQYLSMHIKKEYLYCCTLPSIGKAASITIKFLYIFEY